MDELRRAFFFSALILMVVVLLLEVLLDTNGYRWYDKVLVTELTGFDGFFTRESVKVTLRA